MPSFYPDIYGHTPAGATPIDPVAASLYLANRNLVLMTFTASDGSQLGYAVSAHQRISNAQLLGLFTPLEYATGISAGVQAAAAATGANPTILAGIFQGFAQNYADLDQQTMLDWLQELVTVGALHPSRVAYVLAGVPPAAGSPLPPAVVAAAAAAAAAGGTATATSS